VTTHSAVRNGRVFDLKLSALKAQTPSVVTYNSCTSHLFCQREGLVLIRDADENKTRNDQVTLRWNKN
jgi:hypothetical protein